MKPLQLTLDLVVERCPADWTINRFTASMATETPEQLGDWGTAVCIYRINRSPYGDSPHGLLRFLNERRG